MSIGVVSVVEIGSFLGKSATWFALHKEIKRVTCVDRWLDEESEPSTNNMVSTLVEQDLPRDYYQKFAENMVNTGASYKIGAVRGDSRLVANQVGEADLVYIDGDHPYEGCKSNIQLYAPKALKVVCGDDYLERDIWSESRGVHGKFGVIRAVDEIFPQRQVAGNFWWVVE